MSSPSGVALQSGTESIGKGWSSTKRSSQFVGKGLGRGFVAAESAGKRRYSWFVSSDHSRGCQALTNTHIAGFVVSPHDDQSPERAERLAKAGAKLPTGFGVGSTEDIAEAYLYFARARFTTGTCELTSSLFSSLMSRPSL